MPRFATLQPNTYLSKIKSPLSILVTGSNGFLGMPLVQKLAELGFIVYALDIAPPEKNFRESLSLFPTIYFIRADLCDKESLKKVFDNKIDFIFHLGAFWSFNQGYKDIYERVNLQATEDLFDLAEKHGVKRVIFPSSITAFIPKLNEIITETTQPDPNTSHPYGWCKAENESAIQRRFNDPGPGPGPCNTTVAIVRLTGVFHPIRCELPPLAIAIKRWRVRGPLGRIIPGMGNTGFGYLHVDDFVTMMLQIINKHQQLNPCEVFMATPVGLTTHRELFHLIRKCYGYSPKPFYMSLKFIRLGFKCETFVRKLFGLNEPDEKVWMFDFVDRYYNINPLDTFQKLDWEPQPQRHLLNILPAMIQSAKKNKEWDKIQDERKVSKYLKWHNKNQTFTPTVDSNKNIKSGSQSNTSASSAMPGSFSLITSKLKNKRYSLFSTVGVLGAIALTKACSDKATCKQTGYKTV